MDTGAFKAIRKIGGTGSASGAVTLASIWIAEHPYNLGALGEGCIIRPGVFLVVLALRAGTRTAEEGGEGPLGAYPGRLR